MNTENLAEPLFAPVQFRMSRLQVYNWGTFSNIHDIPISEQGFLFVGRSGTGKSTLLDAISALLVPPRWVDFNAAAREAEKAGRDRNLVSYIRGAWAEQKDDASGEIALRYLRTGTTWTALALSYRDTIGRTVVLVQVMWLRGTSNRPRDVNRHFFILERPFELGELEEFGQTNLDVRKLKLGFPDAYISGEFRPYCERFRRLLGIDSEMALRLLHKTQSAKNLGDLNTFLRDFMLDRPETFRVADRLVSEFDELDAAHQSVVMVRRQIQTLAPAREKYQFLQSLEKERADLEELRGGIEEYRKLCRKQLIGEEIKRLNIKVEGLEGETQRRKTILDQHNAALRVLQDRHHEVGGSQVETWQEEKSELEQQRDACLRKRAQAESACQRLDWNFPETPHGFAELVGNARQELERRQDDSAKLRKERDLLVIKKQEVETAFAETAAEVRALENQTSNIPSTMLEIRLEIAQAIGISESALPFVGELIEINPDEVGWQGAIERVLHGFALSILVDEHHYVAVSNHINAHHLGRRLVYYRTGRVERHQQARPPGANSLVLKLNIKKCDQSDWLAAELRRRFDYACVESIQAFRQENRCLTREGQIKHSKTRHEKDDRHNVGDRRYWVLGFDNREKLALFRKQAQELAASISKLQERTGELSDLGETRAERTMHCQTLVNLQWQEVDVALLLDKIDELERRIRHVLRDNTVLKDVASKIEQQRQAVCQADDALLDTKVKMKTAMEQVENHHRDLEALEKDTATEGLTSKQREGLDERLHGPGVPVRLDNLDSLVIGVMKSLGKQVDATSRQINGLERSIESKFVEFVNEWPAEAEGLDTTLAAAPDFIAKLKRLETDGLPAHEHRFFELLERQSHQNLAALSTHLNNARKEILERMDLVNHSLQRVPFNQSTNQRTFLNIGVNDRQLGEVRQFRQDIQKTLSHAWSEDRDLMESRFKSLRVLVNRLSSQEPEDKRWRHTVLDVRLHMEFIGREFDESGVEVEVYRSGSGKSGGQRQKLATTCLAAALRYQLGGNEPGATMYAPVVLDEAFDKADNEFTTLAMNIFASFGFQVIVATPLKSVMTLEPFIGGACFIDITDRRVSGILMIEYDPDHQRLALPAHTQQKVPLEISS